MTLIVEIKFKKTNKIYFFDPAGITLSVGDFVIVETARGIEIGEVVKAPHEVADETVIQPLKSILRLASAQDVQIAEENVVRQKEALTICEEKILQHKLEMSLVDAEYTFDRSKIIFYFTAEGRIDFRELVKDLSAIFKIRIELRQIGVRDEAKMLGGIGPCGRVICCKQFLTNFQSVSIKMAKEQNLSLNPTKISGLCSRLMCCLKYEQDYYEETLKQMPKINRDVATPDGNGLVTEQNVIKSTVKVRLLLPDGSFDIREYPISQIREA